MLVTVVVPSSLNKASRLLEDRKSDRNYPALPNCFTTRIYYVGVHNCMLSQGYIAPLYCTLPSYYVLCCCSCDYLHYSDLPTHYSLLPLDQQLTTVVLFGRTEEVVRLLGEGAEPNWQNVHGRTALHEACINNDPPTLSVLVNSNANIKIKDKDKETPLHIACEEGYFECVSLLLGAGCHSG